LIFRLTFISEKKENKTNEEITKLSLESLIKNPEINNKDALKSAICVEKEVDGEGEGHFYLLKKCMKNNK